jgi:septal ring factor EnvC (AmiA/AmiB activator)
MKRFQPMLIIVGISLVALVGCTNGEQATIETTPAATANTNVAANPATTSTAGNDGLLTVVSKTKTAVTSSDFVQAKKEFDKFEDVWKEVEDGIKAKSRDNYDAVEKSMDEISGELKAAKPQKDKLLASLQSLEKTINAVSKS